MKSTTQMNSIAFQKPEYNDALRSNQQAVPASSYEELRP